LVTVIALQKIDFMIKKIFLLFFFGFVTLSNFSQERRTLIFGKISDSLSSVKNANIINLKTNQGTFSSDNGEFKMFVKEGDSLKISSIQHITKFIFIYKNYINHKSVDIKLSYNSITLDTFELKRHNLYGRLGIDSKSVPTDKKDSLLHLIMDFSKVNMKIIEGDDDIDKMKPPINNVDPTAAFVGAGVSISMPFKSSGRLWALRKELSRKRAFPYTIMSELGEEFFFKELKIPVNNYFHFLEYCNPLDIEVLHNNRKLLDIIKIFQTESKTYLEIIKND
jgi:hypothetical protein